MLQKCDGYCRKLLPIEKFGVNQKTDAPYSRCPPCREKKNAARRARQKAMSEKRKAEQKAEEERLLREVGPTQKCVGGCGKKLPIEKFGTNKKTGAPCCRCPPCTEKNKRGETAKARRNAEKRAKRVAAWTQPIEQRPAKTEELRLLRAAGPTKVCLSCGKEMSIDYFGEYELDGEKKRYCLCIDCKPKVVAYLKKADVVEKGKAARKRAKTSEKVKASNKRWKVSEKGRAANKRQNVKPINHLRGKLYKMLHDGPESITMRTLMGPEYAKDLEAHLRSTREPWMTDDNSGSHRAGNDYGVVHQIGHRIPCAAYDQTVREDLRRCMSLPNLFAQDARENNELGTKLPSAQVLLSLRAYWPTGWNDQLPASVVAEANGAASSSNAFAVVCPPPIVVGVAVQEEFVISSDEEDDSDEEIPDEDHVVSLKRPCGDPNSDSEDCD